MPRVFSYDTRVEPEKALLVAVDTGRQGIWTVTDSLKELAELTATTGARVVGQLVQKLGEPNKTTYLGRGKIAQLLDNKSTTGFNLVIFDDELTPLQQQNLEKELGVKVIDRAALILDVFARSARTREGKLQVELAQHQYLMPRLAGQWSHLERLGGGIGTRGPGESQLETDRRLIRRKITRLKEQLEQVRTQRRLYRDNRQRRGVPVVALVGYTNTGKSTLFNALSGSDVLAQDRLFATLDPTTRRLRLPDNSAVLLTDTVGFIHKLPTDLIEAFRATLEELQDASILVHLVDLTSHNASAQCQVVESILADLNLQSKPRITAINKIDLLLAQDRAWDEATAVRYLDRLTEGDPRTVLISAKKKWGLQRLLEVIAGMEQDSEPKRSLNDAL